jgi:RNA polymerase sigma-70 factor (ECF subfamily)
MFNIENYVQKSKNGDISSFMELLKEKEVLIYKISFSYTKNSYDAEDCISEASIKAFDKLKQLRNEDKFYCWFISILINVCRKTIKNKITASSEEILNQVRDEFSYKSIDDMLIVDGLLSKLRKDERDILALRYLKDLSIKEIAIIMDIPLSTVKTKIYRSLTFLRTKNGGMKNEY